MLPLYLFVTLLAAAVLVCVGWRLASRRESLPCPVWLRWFVELDNPFTRVNRAAVIIEHLDVAVGMRVADIGCGPGRLTLPLAEAVGTAGEVVAVDVQEGMLARVREKAAAAGIDNIQYLRTAIGEGALDTAGFDRAALVTVLGEIPDRQAAMAEVFAALKPGGILAVTEVIFDPHFQGRDTIRQLATEAGFRERAFHGRRLAYTLLFEKPA